MMTIATGIEVFIQHHADKFSGRVVGLLTSPSSVDYQLVSIVNRLHTHPDINLVALFGPEHGLRGEAQAGQHVRTYTDKITGLPVYSLYGETRKPTPEMLQGLDVLLIDLQDGGVRFYTYLATMANVMQAASENGIEVIVLDRPAPITGSIIEGPMLDPNYISFVGPYPLPVRYGMTIGEMAKLLNEHFGIGCNLRIIPLENWSRNMWFDDTGLPFVAPSPNLPTLDSMILYPGTCWIEGTNLSEGRGTTRPFEYLGAPWIDAEGLSDRMNDLNLKGVRFRPVYFVPSFSKYQGEQCNGIHLYVTDRQQFRPVNTVCHLIDQVIEHYPDQFQWRAPWTSESHYPIDLLSGSSTLREHLDARKPVYELTDSWQQDVQAFMGIRKTCLLYAE